LEELSVSPYLLAAIFSVVAFFYSAVGLGGGSSYTALLAIFGANYIAIPSISLTLNVMVTTVGSINFIHRGHARLRLLLPFLLGSMPLAYVGGAIGLPKVVFYWILLLSLVVVAWRIYAPFETSLKVNLSSTQTVIVSLVAGGVLGFIAGAVGIGGGIYLVPIIILLGLGTPKEAAAVGAIFIWINSLSGLFARFEANRIDMDHVLPLIIAVVAGGVLGSWLGAGHFSTKLIEKLLGVVIVTAIILLGRNLLNLM